VTNFHAALKKQGVDSVAIVAPNMEHAFDIWAEVGGKVDVEILSQAVDWVARYAV
jgi:peroxiredoxin